MKFCHIADVHLGSWKERELSILSDKFFIETISKCIREKIDFLLIAGDLFDTSLPNIEKIKIAVEQLKLLKNAGINVYAIAGSHDYSPTGKTVLEVLERADLLKIVSRGEMFNEKLKLEFIKDEKTNAIITGIPGRKGMLDRKYYELLDRSIKNEEGFKIFMLHTALTELKPKSLEHMESQPLSLLPEGFDYYAAGHMHINQEADYHGGKIVFPGPLFPCNFKEMEDGYCGYVIYDNGKINFIKNDIKILKIDINLNGKPSEFREKILESLNEITKDAIVTIRVSGVLDGRISEINFKEIFQEAYKRGAYFVLKNISKLSTKQLEEIRLEISSKEDIEEKIINEHINQINVHFNEKKIINELIQVLSEEKADEERASDFSKRIIDNFENLLMRLNEKNKNQ